MQKIVKSHVSEKKEDANLSKLIKNELAAVGYLHKKLLISILNLFLQKKQRKIKFKVFRSIKNNFARSMHKRQGCQVLFNKLQKHVFKKYKHCFKAFRGDFLCESINKNVVELGLICPSSKCSDYSAIGGSSPFSLGDASKPNTKLSPFKKLIPDCAQKQSKFCNWKLQA